MANQTISADTNHDTLTGRAAGEDITINSGAVLTIDSCPHLTSMGILGDITISDGTLRIDGSRTFEVAYSSGSGTYPAVGNALSWNGGADTGKVIRLDSGNATSGVLTMTVDVGSTTPDDADTITDTTSGSWSADLDTVKVGFLIVYGEDQDWGSVDGRSSLVVTGDWYEVATGTGADNQSITLPHSGNQPAVWVETGNGTGVFDIWHLVLGNGTDTVFFNDPTQFGNTFESGFVFKQTFGSSTLTFGTSTGGGAPPSGARIRIPNVHIGTTTTGAPTTEVNSATLNAHIGLVAPNTNLNVSIDHLNGSSCYVDFRGTNGVTVSDSCWSLFTSSAFINKVNASILLSNCAIITPSIGVAGNTLASCACAITDNIGGITIDDCVIYGGLNSNNAGGLILTTMANLAFTGRCKLASNQQDENTMYPLRAATASNITAETLISLGGPISVSTGSNNWAIDELVYGLPPGRGTTEENIVNALIHAASLNCEISSGRLATGGAKHGRNYIVSLTDSDSVTIRNFGAVDDKIDGEARCTGVVTFVGITSNVKVQRVWYDNLNSSAAYAFVNSVADVDIINCSADYNDEIEIDATRVLVKGCHGASGTPDAATGVEGDLVNCLASCFLDYFKSDTTGALGLIFNDRGVKHAGDIVVTAGTPIWNGLGDLLMRNLNDQVVYTWPYEIKGHTAFQNAAIQVSAVGSYFYEYDLDTGSGFSGTWTTINGTNLSAETISPAGFRFKVRITAAATNTNAAIKGLAVLTETTLAAQAANLYPLDQIVLTLTGIESGSDIVILAAGTTTERANIDANASTTYAYAYTTPENVDVCIYKAGFVPYTVRDYSLGTSDASLPIAQVADRNYTP